MGRLYGFPGPRCLDPNDGQHRADDDRKARDEQATTGEGRADDGRHANIATAEPTGRGEDRQAGKDTPENAHAYRCGYEHRPPVDDRHRNDRCGRRGRCRGDDAGGETEDIEVDSRQPRAGDGQRNHGNQQQSIFRRAEHGSQCDAGPQ